jgi:hypothetical protein
MIFRAFQVLAALFFVFPARAQPVSGTGPADDPTRQTDADWIDNRWSKTENRACRNSWTTVRTGWW